MNPKNMKVMLKGLKTYLRSRHVCLYRLLHNIFDIANRRKPIAFDSFDFRSISAIVKTHTPVILDIGAHEGDEISLFLEYYPNASVYAVEADPSPYLRLKKRFAHDSRVKCFNVAIAHYNGQVLFNCSSGWFQDKRSTEHDCSGSILFPKLHLELAPNVAFVNQINVECQTLDSFIEENSLDIPDFIWMDVQGAEYNVLLGGGAVLNKVKGLYTEYGLLELYEGQKDLWFIETYLQSFGFSLKKRYPCDALFVKSRL